MKMAAKCFDCNNKVFQQKFLQYYQEQNEKKGYKELIKIRTSFSKFLKVKIKKKLFTDILKQNQQLKR